MNYSILEKLKYLKKSQHDDDRCNCVSRDVVY
jgi:hypothetical protein